MKRKVLYDKLIQSFDVGYDLVLKYDSFPHQYGDETLFQIEMHVIQYIGRHDCTTVTQIAADMNKTVSACSQMVRKLCGRGIILQKRNPANNREYHLRLTELGWAIYEAHEKIDQFCMERTFDYLKDFTDEELMAYISVQNKLNEAFQEDVNNNQIILEF